MDVGSEFRLDRDAARVVLGEVLAATSRWRAAAAAVQLDKPAVERMAPAFQHEQVERARAIVSG